MSKNLSEENWKMVSNHIYNQMLEKEEEILNREGSVLREYISEVQKIYPKIENSIQAEIFCKNNNMLTRDITLEFYKKATILSEKSSFIDVLINKENKEFVLMFFEEFKKADNYSLIVSLGNFLIINYDLKFKNFYLDFINKTYSNTHYFFIIYCIKKLKLKEAIPTYINMLENDELLVLALNGLSVYKDTNLKPYFIKYLDSKNPDARRICKKALKSIEKVEEKDKNKSNLNNNKI